MRSVLLSSYTLDPNFHTHSSVGLKALTLMSVIALTINIKINASGFILTEPTMLLFYEQDF